MRKLGSGLAIAGRGLALLLALLILVPIWLGVGWTLLNSWLGVLAGIVLGAYLVMYVLERWFGANFGIGAGDAEDAEDDAP